MDTMTFREISLPDELERAYQQLYTNVRRLAQQAYTASNGVTAVSSQDLTACRAVLFDIERFRMMIVLQEGRETKTLSPGKG
jgi:hypothetical protein